MAFDEMTPSPIMRDNIRKILDANIGSNNKISYKRWYKLCLLTINEIKKVVLNSFGKYGGNSLVVVEGGYDAKVFSNDGIHLVSSLEFISPIQKYIASLIQYIGECIEKSARDGTSTGILVFCSIIESIYESLLDLAFDQKSNEPSVEIRKYNFLLFVIKKYIEKLIKDLQIYLKENKTNIEEIESRDRISKKDIIKDICMITTKGDEDISSILSEIYSELPLEIIDSYFVYTRSSVETDKKISILEQDYDIKLPIIRIAGKEHFDKEFSTVFHEDHVNLCILPNKLFDTDVELIDKIVNYIEESKYPVVLLTNGINANLAVDLSNKYNKKKLVILEYVNYINSIKESGIELRGILLGNMKTHDQYFVDDVDIKITFNEIFINNLIEYDKRYSKVNKMYFEVSESKYPEFYDFVMFVKKKINDLAKGHIKSSIDFEIKEYMRILKSIIAPKMPVIKIGGKTLDHLATINVIEDAVGTIISCLENGIIINGIDQINEFFKEKYNETQELFKTFLNNYNRIDILSKLSSMIDYDLSYSIRTKSMIQMVIYVLDNIAHNIQTNISELANHNSSFIYNMGYVFNNFKTFEELSERLLEIVPKLVQTTTAIVPGTVSMNDDDKK